METIGRYAVSAQPTAGGWVSTGIAFEDYTRMGVQVHKLARGRRYDVPSWVLNPAQLADVIVRAMESRAALNGTARHVAQVADLPALERLSRAEKLLLQRRPELTARIGKICAAYMEAEQSGDHTYAEKLAIQIGSLDTQLCTLDRMAAIMTGTAFLYWRCGYDSVETARELNIKPPHVRQLLCRFLCTAARAGYPPPVPFVHVPRPSSARPRPRYTRIPGAPRVPNYIQVQLKNSILELRRAGKFSIDIARELDLGPDGCEMVNRVISEAQVAAPAVPAPPVGNPSYQRYVDYCTRMGIAARPEIEWADVDTVLGPHGLHDNGVRAYCAGRA